MPFSHKSRIDIDQPIRRACCGSPRDHPDPGSQHVPLSASSDPNGDRKQSQANILAFVHFGGRTPSQTRIWNTIVPHNAQLVKFVDVLVGCYIRRVVIPGLSTELPVPVLVGSTVYAVGILTEAISETQRYRFKRDPNNKGKLYTG